MTIRQSKTAGPIKKAEKKLQVEKFCILSQFVWESPLAVAIFLRVSRWLCDFFCLFLVTVLGTPARVDSRQYRLDN